jgi:flagellar motility protein MotE (MotC chaperone)
MAKEMNPTAAAVAEERSKLKEEKKQFKQEQKAQRKEARRRAAEIAKQEEDLGEDGGGGLVTLFATILIVVLWLTVACVIVKMDIGGFGSSVLSPILKDVPVLNMILPGTSSPSVDGEETEEGYGGYTNLKEAVDYIRQLELELERAQTASNSKDADLESLKAEVLRLQEFEQKQVEFQRIKNEFYQEVVYSEKGPGLDAYLKYYESMDPTTAETLAKQVMLQQQESSQFQDYAKTFAAMKPKAAATSLEELNDLNLAARVLNALTAEERAAILNVMNSEMVAKVMKMMNPDA